MPTAVDDSPSPTPSRSRSALSLGFRSPVDPLSSPTLPSPSSSPEILDEPAPDSEAEWFDESGPSLDDTPSQGSTPGSDDDAAGEGVKVELFTEEELIDLARGGVAQAGEKAHELFATSEGQQAVDLYRTDVEDQANIGDPIARIASRHQGSVGKVNPDTKDFLSMLVGIAGYATKQLNKRNEARALDAGRVLPQPEQPQAVDL